MLFITGDEKNQIDFLFPAALYSRPEAAMQKLKVGLIGTGYIGLVHLEVLRRIVEAEVVAVADPDIQKARARAAEFGIPAVHDSVAEMLDKHDLDILDIASSRSSHPENVRLAAALGVHVLCQKPLANTLVEAEQLVGEVEGVVRLMVNDNRRFRSDFRQIAAWIKVAGLHGMSKDAWKRFSDEGYKHYKVVECGFKYNMMDLQAAIGIHQLERIEPYWKRREQIWKQYNKAFANLPVGLPADPEPNTRHAYHLYTIRIDEKKAGISRDKFLDAMTARKIGVGVHLEINDFVLGHFVDFAQRAAEKPRPMADRLFDAERRPPLDHRAFVEHAAVVFQKRAALGEHFVFDHLVVGQAEVAALFEDDLNMAGRLGMDHFVGDMIGEVFLQLRMALKKR